MVWIDPEDVLNITLGDYKNGSVPVLHRLDGCVGELEVNLLARKVNELLKEGALKLYFDDQGAVMVKAHECPFCGVARRSSSHLR
jgi:hypothetical protein